MAEIARIVWDACGRDPKGFALEHLPTFPVDVVRRWPSVEKARRCSGGRPGSACATGSGRRRVAARAARRGLALKTRGIALKDHYGTRGAPEHVIAPPAPAARASPPVKRCAPYRPIAPSRKPRFGI